MMSLVGRFVNLTITYKRKLHSCEPYPTSQRPTLKLGRSSLVASVCPVHDTGSLNRLRGLRHPSMAKLGNSHRLPEGGIKLDPIIEPVLKGPWTSSTYSKLVRL